MTAADARKLSKRVLCFAVGIGIWFAPIPAGLTSEAWHLFAVFAAAILSLILDAFPLKVTASLLAVVTVVIDGHDRPGQGLRRLRKLGGALVVVPSMVGRVVKSVLAALSCSW